MSSYLTFYIVPKEENSKPLKLISYSRNTDIYRYFNETINPVYIGIDEIQYTELTVSKIDMVLEEIKNDLEKAISRVSVYEKHVCGKADLIEDIISQNEYINELKVLVNNIEFIKKIVIETSYSWSDYNKVLCNID